MCGLPHLNAFVLSCPEETVPHTPSKTLQKQCAIMDMYDVHMAKLERLKKRAEDDLRRAEDDLSCILVEIGNVRAANSEAREKRKNDVSPCFLCSMQHATMRPCDQTTQRGMHSPPSIPTMHHARPHRKLTWR